MLLVPDTLPLTVVVKVLQNLLHEGVPIRDMRTIVQTLVDYGSKSQDVDVLTASCRVALKRLIIQEVVGSAPEVPVITFAPDLEQMLHQSMQSAGNDGAGIEPGLAERIQQSLATASQNQELSWRTCCFINFRYSAISYGTIREVQYSRITGFVLSRDP